MAENDVSVVGAGAPMPSVPLHVFFGEAVDAARFAKKYWSSEVGADGRVIRAGLETAGKLLPDVGDVIVAALDEAQKAHTAYLFVVTRSGDAVLRARAATVLSEITATLAWHLDDGDDDDNDARFDRLGEVHSDTGEAADAIALALHDYAALAKPLQEALHGLGGFDGAMIDEAPLLAAKLRELPAVPQVASDESRAALAARNAKIAALYGHVRQVRAAARFVFRGQPQIVREVTSAWERKTRAERARAAKNAQPEA